STSRRQRQMCIRDSPIAQAFKREKAGLTYQAEEVKNTNGAGLEGLIQGEQYYLGSKQYIEGCIGFSDSTGQTKNSTVYLANSNGLIAIFNIEDDIRQGAETLVSWLKEQGKTVSLISGDHQAPVSWLARHLSISHYKFDTTPSEKLAEVEALQAEDVQVAMVGDGMNDAPVMAQADVSISVSGASQLARSSSDILLMGDDMRNLEKAFNMSIRTRYVIKQNMLWALVYNIGALPLAISGQLEPWQAALGMSLSSLMVVLNSFRLRLNIFSK
ncbi:MAG: HAD-IC family P-type ATPase, partial [Cycloclasticus sp.]|nr:HAD-IC family P-type ATPase [Cycloclasticus sp.]